MKAQVNTKSNYRNLNGSILEVVEVKGKRVTLKVWMSEVGRYNNVDFTLSEVEFV